MEIKKAFYQLFIFLFLLAAVAVRYVNNYLGGTVTLAGNGMGTGGNTTDYKQITITVSWLSGWAEEKAGLKTILANCPK